MTERFFTAENVIDLIMNVFPLRILEDKEGRKICQAVLAVTKDGEQRWLTLSNMLKDNPKYDIYDSIYCLLHRAAQIRTGEVDMKDIDTAEEGEDPIEKLLEIMNKVRDPHTS